MHWADAVRERRGRAWRYHRLKDGSAGADVFGVSLREQSSVAYTDDPLTDSDILDKIYAELSTIRGILSFWSTLYGTVLVIATLLLFGAALLLR